MAPIRIFPTLQLLQAPNGVRSPYLQEMHMKRTPFLLIFPVVLSSLVWAQENSAAPMYPAAPHPQQPPASNQDATSQQMNQNTGQDIPVFRVSVFARTTKAVNYRHRSEEHTSELQSRQY